MADRLTEILDRVAALPPGPWTAAADLGGTVWVIDSEGNTVDGQPFLDFITAARTDVPWLLTEIERLTSELDYTKSLLTLWHESATRDLTEPYDDEDDEFEDDGREYALVRGEYRPVEDVHLPEPEESQP